MPTEDELARIVAAQQEAIDELRREVAELRRRGADRPDATDRILSRRALFGLAGAGIATVAVGAGAPPAGAADGDAVMLGQVNEATQTTTITYGVDPDGRNSPKLLVESTDPEDDGAAIAARSAGRHAVMAEAAAGFGGVAVYGVANGALSAGIEGSSDSVGVRGNGTATDGDGPCWGVYGQSEHADHGIGVAGHAPQLGTLGQATAAGGTGVLGEAQEPLSYGVRGQGTLFGVQGAAAFCGIGGQSDDGYAAGLSTASGAHLLFERTGAELVGPPEGPPEPGYGVLSMDSTGDVFYGHEGQAGAMWTRLNQQGPTFLPTAQRAFDSRPGQAPADGGGTKGALASGEVRRIDLTVATDVPASTTAVIVNLTATGTTGAGYAAVYPAGAAITDPGAFSHLNWSGAGETVGNTTFVTTADGQIDVYVSRGTHLVVDVIGYHT